MEEKKDQNNFKVKSLVIKKAKVEKHSIRFSNLISADNDDDEKNQLEVQEMKKSESKKKKVNIKQRKILELSQIKELREKDGNKIYNPFFFENIEEDQIKNKSNLNLHGLALVRFLLHKHPTKSPFLLDSTSFCYVSSSIGMIDLRLLFDLAYAFVPGFKYEFRHLSDDLSEKIRNMFSVVYPSKIHVTESALGPENANCLFLDHDRHYSRKFEKSILAKFKGNGNVKNNENVIPHLKIIIISNDHGKINDDTIVYLGSHNMTKAAWGRFNRLGDRLFVSNYEMGVVIPPREGSTSKKKDLIRKLGFVYPAKKFAPKERPFTRKCNGFRK